MTDPRELAQKLEFLLVFFLHKDNNSCTYNIQQFFFKISNYSTNIFRFLWKGEKYHQQQQQESSQNWKINHHNINITN